MDKLVAKFFSVYSTRVYFLFITGLSCLFLLFMHHSNEVPVDVGDGLAHYFIAQQVFTEPVNLLNHWGKPLFTLLSSPFSYFGFTTYIYFNILVFAATCLTAFRLFTILNVRPILSCIFPFVLLTVPDYTTNVLGGMTEPLFGLLVLLSALLLVRKKFMYFALLLSLTPFSRSEGQFLVLLGIIALLYYKQFKIIPLLFSGFLLYSLIGGLVLNDFWWYFTQNPYQGAESIYGRGDWLHYYTNRNSHLGPLGAVVLFFLIVGLLVSFLKKNFPKPSKEISLYLFIIYAGILLTHSYLWATGNSGAAGLSRLATQGLPGMLVAGIVVINYAFSQRIVLSQVFSLVCIGWSVFQIDKLPLPKKASPNELAVMETGKWAKEYAEQHNTPNVFYYHPLVAYSVHSNLKNTEGRFQQRPFHFFEEELQRLKGGELIIWESHFGDREMGLKKDLFTRFTELKSITPMGQYIVSGQPPYEVKVLRYDLQPLSAPQEIKKYTDSITTTISSTDLYKTLFEFEEKEKADDQYTRIRITIDTETNPVPDFIALLKQNDTGETITLEIGESNQWELYLDETYTGKYELFIYNPNGVEAQDIRTTVSRSILQKRY